MKIGLLGYGVVGGGVYELTKARGGSELDIARVLVRRERAELSDVAVTAVEDILADASIDTVVEVLGGEEPAHSMALRAIKAGKHLVTANKLMLSEHYEQLVRAARERGVSIAFSASVGGGIPFLVNVIQACQADDILALGGIMNGTTNYILSAMTNQGAEFGEALAAAQRLGYAEADPTADIDGLDARCKLALAASVAWGGALEPGCIPVLGIRSIRAFDVAIFRQMGLCCKLIARAERTQRGVAAYVRPELFALGAPEAGVNGTGNLISFTGARIGKQCFSGLGAGKEPTAYAVYKDLMDVAGGGSPFDRVNCGQALCLDGENAKPTRAYVRTSAALPSGLCPESSLGGGAYLLEPVPPAALAAAMETIRKTDPGAFAAGLE